MLEYDSAAHPCVCVLAVFARVCGGEASSRDRLKRPSLISEIVWIINEFLGLAGIWLEGTRRRNEERMPMSAAKC